MHMYIKCLPCNDCGTFTENYPYKMGFTLKHIVALFKDEILIHVYIQSVFVAICTAIFGTVIAFFSAVINSRTKLKGRKAVNLIAMLTNTIPGMILGLSYLLFFQGSSIKRDIFNCNIKYYCSLLYNSYLMAKGAMDKLDQSWDITSSLLQDSWFETIFKIILPNMKSTVIEIMNYYFINAMVTISGVIFLVSTSTQIVSTQINQLQHFNRFTDIFILSILILLTNLAVRFVSAMWLRYEKGGNVVKIKLIIFGIICAVLLYFSYAGLGASSDKVIIQTNADEEAIAAMETALNNHGYRGEYIVQPQSTSELGGKIMAEGENIDADIVTQASYYLESAQKEHHMFVPLHSSMNQQEIKKYPDYMTPILGNMGSLL